MMPERTVRSGLLLLAALLIGGCFSTGDGEEPDHYYRVVIESEKGGQSPFSLSVALRPFDTDEILDREGILYQTSDVERGYWSSHQWIEPVAGMVRSAIQGDLEQSGLFEAVYLPDNETLADLVVNAEIHEFGEVDRPDGWYGVVDITFEAVRARDASLVWRSRVRVEEQAAQRTVLETVRALGRALGRATEELKAGIIAGAR